MLVAKTLQVIVVVKMFEHDMSMLKVLILIYALVLLVSFAKEPYIRDDILQKIYENISTWVLNTI